jgi:hypothetical protein
MSTKKKPVIMVSSTVYGIEELLNRIYTLLTGFHYEVWMSHKGTMPVLSKRTSFENCIKAVERCDLFLGLITPYYGSGRDDDNISICHQELRKAVELNKPRWLLAHDHVVFAHSLIKNLKYHKSGRAVTARLTVKKTAVIDDLRVIDMYQEAILSEKPLRDRQGNWVHKFQSTEDALLFAQAQFSRYQEVEEFIRENLSDIAGVQASISGKGVCS